MHSTQPYVHIQNILRLSHLALLLSNFLPLSKTTVMNWVITDIQPIQVLCKVNQYSLATGQLTTLMDGTNLYLDSLPKDALLETCSYALLLSLGLSLKHTQTHTHKCKKGVFYFAQFSLWIFRTLALVKQKNLSSILCRFHRNESSEQTQLIRISMNFKSYPCGASVGWKLQWNIDKLMVSQHNQTLAVILRKGPL